MILEVYIFVWESLLSEKAFWGAAVLKSSMSHVPHSVFLGCRSYQEI